MPDQETPLDGGNVGGAVRVGDTVRRPTGPWTPAVHELLDFLAAAGLPHVPRVLGFDEQRREILTYLPGRVVPVGVEPLSDAQVRSTMHWLRRYHEVVARFPRGSRRWRFVERALEPGEIVCHHDVAVYNLAFERDALVGVFDWDVAGPGRPIDDLAIFAWNSPLLDARGDPSTAAHGLRVMASAYGDVRPQDVLDHVTVRMTAAADRIEAAQRSGDPGMLRLGQIGEPASTRARVAAMREHAPAIRALLTR